jgi:hypothetical protein
VGGTVEVVSATTLPLTGQVSTQQVQQAIGDRVTNVQDLSLPVFVNGQLPSPVPENPLVIQTNSETRLDIITINEQVIQLQDTDGFRLSVSATDERGVLTRVSTSGAIIVEQQNFITVSGEGFKPDSDAVAWLFSEPRRLGVVRVGSDGKFQDSLQIGSEVPTGQHTTQVNGLTPDGEVRSLNLAVEVVRSVVDVSDSLDPTANSIRSLQTRDGDRDTELWVGILTVAILISVGFGFILGLRRRSEDEESEIETSSATH